MKNLISQYQHKISMIDKAILNNERIIRDTRNDNERQLENEDARINNKILRSKRQTLVQVVVDIETCDLVVACTELNSEDAFAHVQDVVSMISKGGNLLEIHAINDGNGTSRIADALQSIANNISKALK
jgi:hypothetical protein